MKTEITEKEEQVNKNIVEKIKEFCRRLKLEIKYQELDTAIDFLRNCTRLDFTPRKQRFIIAESNDHIGKYQLYFDTNSSTTPNMYHENCHSHFPTCFKLTLAFEAEPEKIKILFSDCNYGKHSFSADAKYKEILTIKINI